jgi:hypothetical protein
MSVLHMLSAMSYMPYALLVGGETLLVQELQIGGAVEAFVNNAV